MLENDVFEPAVSKWAAPAVILPKPKQPGKWRFYVDYRKLNTVKLRDCYPLPRMDDCINSLHSAKIFSTLDCYCGFRQMPIREEDRDKTTFTCYSGTYQHKKMPLGLMNAPATFQRALDIILGGYRLQTCMLILTTLLSSVSHWSST